MLCLWIVAKSGKPLRLFCLVAISCAYYITVTPCMDTITSPNCHDIFNGDIIPLSCFLLCRSCLHHLSLNVEANDKKHGQGLYKHKNHYSILNAMARSKSEEDYNRNLLCLQGISHCKQSSYIIKINL